jgi:hypothetical protein
VAKAKLASLGRKNMKKIAVACALTMALTSWPALGQTSRPISSPNNYKELYAFLAQCLFFPRESAGSEMTLQFSLTQYGALKGKPRITYSKLTGSLEVQKEFVSSALKAVENCTPVPLTEHFGRIVNTRILAWRVIARTPSA